ncbi:MAG: tRNA (guanosine(37)-N1)-methyltransferase TrmD [Arcobacteraceae bacterium]|nr:tRNA (guanosine(37)-N1)-methyltransferase TrmD [Arcobacteraceae bacterium]
MNFTFITLFPNLIDFYFKDSILKIAVEKQLISYDFFNPRDFTTNKHKKVDDTLCGGGAGQLMTTQPLFDCLKDIKSKYEDAYIIFPLAAAKPFNQKDAKRLAKKKNLVFVSGRYEGIDERVIETYANEVFSVGEYILTGGELPSLIMADAISRNVDGVLGNQESLDGESYGEISDNNSKDGLLEAPNFAKPIKYEDLSVPSEYLKGNHAKIHDLKNKLSVCKTKYYRP